MATDVVSARWPLDLKIYGALNGIWGLGLMFRLIVQNPFVQPGESIQAVIGGIKFYGSEARGVLLTQAVIYLLIANGIIQQRRWGLIAALLYVAQVVAAHLLFVIWYAGVPGQEIHVKIASFEGPAMVLILLYLWMRSRELLRRRAAGIHLSTAG